MHEDIADQITVFCEDDPLRRKRIAAAFEQSGYPGRLAFVSSLSEAVANIASGEINIIFLRRDHVGTVPGYAGGICADSPAAPIFIMVTPGSSELESLEAIRNGADEAVSGDENCIASYPRAAARALARRASLLLERKRVGELLRQWARPASIGMLVPGVAHDINNALTGVLAYAELLGQEVFDVAAGRDLQKILESAERCKKILDNLLSFARERPPVKSLESVNDLIDRTIDLCGYRLRSRGIGIARDYAAGLPAVFLDAQRLQHAILNLLEYAEQSMSAPGRPPGKITFTTRYRNEDRVLTLRISDNGPGIPENCSERIFGPFSPLKPVTAGGSFGLSEAYAIIKEHDGTISAQNDPAGGSVFVIELPAGAAPAA